MACLNCKTLIELMRREIDELKDKEGQLMQVNATLQAAANRINIDNS